MSSIQTAPAEPIHPVDRHVGRRVAKKRILLGHNQSELGRALKVSFQQIQKYEKGANRISASKLWAIAGFLQVDIRYFFDGLDAGDPQSDGVAMTAALTTAPVTRTGLEITRLAPRLPVMQQKLVLELLREFASDAPLSDAA